MPQLDTTHARSLRIAAGLLLAGQLLYIGVTFFHAGGQANHHESIFQAYADSANWKAVHLAQFAATAILLVGLASLPYAAAGRSATPWTGRVGAAMAIVGLAAYAVLQAVDGVALKQAVDAWAAASGEERAARFATAETVRWVEWGVRGYHNVAVGLSMALLAVALWSAAVPRVVPVFMALAGGSYLFQGWVLGAEGFSATETVAILATYALSLVWMVALAVAAWRTGAPARRSSGDAAGRVA